MCEHTTELTELEPKKPTVKPKLNKKPSKSEPKKLETDNVCSVWVIQIQVRIPEPILFL